MQQTVQQRLPGFSPGSTPAKFDYRACLESPDAAPVPFYVTGLGALFATDCMQVLPRLKGDSIHTVFADPPFNLGKQYGQSTTDALAEADYLSWSHTWLAECVRVLVPGGALFLYNLPKWNLLLGAYLHSLGLQFRHWIAIDQTSGYPIAGRLYPAHYSLLYFTKGPPRTFRRIRTPVPACRHCKKELKDYGGHRGALNPKGITLKDIWTDIPPVRHWKFKSKERRANALSTKILDRVVELTTQEGDLVLDPFGGSGTTFAVSEQKHRRWIGTEIDFAKEIVARFETEDLGHHQNLDVVDP